jgi:hypothetical protein
MDLYSRYEGITIFATKVPSECGTDFVVLFATYDEKLKREVLDFITNECEHKDLYISQTKALIVDGSMIYFYAHIKGSKMDIFTIRQISSKSAFRKGLFQNEEKLPDVKIKLELNIINILGLLHVVKYNLLELTQKVGKYASLVPLVDKNILHNSATALLKQPRIQTRIKFVALMQRDKQKNEISYSFVAATRFIDSSTKIKSVLDALFKSRDDISIDIHEVKFNYNDKTPDFSGVLYLCGLLSQGNLLMMYAEREEEFKQEVFYNEVKHKLELNENMETSYLKSYMMKCSITGILWKVPLNVIYLDALCNLLGSTPETIMQEMSLALQNEKSMIFVHSIK